MTRIRAVFLFVALGALSSCTTMRNIGEGLCSTQEEVSAGITEMGSMFGMPGNAVARAMNIFFGTTCNVLAGAVALPANTTEDVLGLFGVGAVDDDPLREELPDADVEPQPER